MDKKILITGGAGYLGSIMCETLLRNNFEVLALDTISFDQTSLFHLCNNKKFNFIFGDARDEAIMKPLIKEADVIIPLAAIVGAPACDRDPIGTKSINFDAIKMLNRIRTKDQLIIYPNTNSGYGTKSSDLHCDEDSPLEPISLYGRVKVDAERELLESENTIVLRLATVFGMSPRMRIDLLVNHFVYTALNEKYIVIFEKDFKRNYIHIRDVADCFRYCIEKSDTMVGKIYNLGLDDANLSKKELALKIKEYIPEFYIHFSEIGQDVDKRNYIVSNKRLQDAGFTAKRSIDEGIQELLKGFEMIKHRPFTNL